MVLPTVEMHSQKDEAEPCDSAISVNGDPTGDASPVPMVDSVLAAENGDANMEDGDAATNTRSLSDTGSATNIPNRTGDDWKYSVRVNVASGTRSSIVLSTSSQDSEEVVVQKPATKTEAAGNVEKRLHDAATVRVLREPGDSGKSVYDCLYGGESGMPLMMGGAQHTETAQLGDSEQRSATDKDVSQAEQGVDVEMDEADVGEETLLPDDVLPVSHAMGEEAEHVSTPLSEITTDDPDAASMPAPVQLIETLPDIHEYFSHRGSSEDVRILHQALTHVRTADPRCLVSP